VGLAMLDRTEEALACLRRAAALEPGYAETWAFNGDIEQRLGRTAEAIASLRRYLALKPGSREKRVEVVRRQLWAITHPGRLLDRDRAQQCETEALRRSTAGAFAEALPLFDAAVEADPLFDEAWINRSTCLHWMSRFEEALLSLEKAEELTGLTSHVADGMATCLVKLGRGEEALRCFDRLLARQPASPEARRGKARTLVLLGRPAEALPLYQKLLARAPARRMRSSRPSMLTWVKSPAASVHTGHAVPTNALGVTSALAPATGFALSSLSP
jgi:tetratricopeptide (TPR) repeat protein